jgi:hypothetical protein
MALEKEWLALMEEKSWPEEGLKEEKNYLYLLKTDISINDN